MVVLAIKIDNHNLVSNHIYAIVDFGKQENKYDNDTNPIDAILNVLSNNPGIHNARVVNEQPTVRDVNK